MLTTPSPHARHSFTLHIPITPLHVHPSSLHTHNSITSYTQLHHSMLTTPPLHADHSTTSCRPLHHFMPTTPLLHADHSTTPFSPLHHQVQILAFNSQLFRNFSDAAARAHGVVVLSILVQIGTDNINPELRILTDAIDKIRFAGSYARISQLSVQGLLPPTDHYFTYEGSLTQPPCHETVTWLVLNKPIYATKTQLRTLRKLHQGTMRSPKAKMVNNFRPVQLLYHRPLRTNIDFTRPRPKSATRKDDDYRGECPSMGRQMYYTANTWR
ncbi:Alpha carbonic anhydrase [Trinorchestia longiramus]|nr:Alpha carbonic anhydrase [Trinorchestia longiramus]